NCEGDNMTHGVMYANCGPALGRNAGGVGRHCPGALPPRNGGGAGVMPSVRRQAQIESATVCPHSIPRAIDSLFSVASSLAIASSDAWRCTSSVLCCDGYRWRIAAYAAWTTAARREAPR